MPTYEQKCTKCGYQWEDFYKINGPIPNCPKCGSEAKRLLFAVPGTVELTGKDLVQKIQNDAKKLQNDAVRSEKVMANLVGEDKMQQNQVLRDSLKKEIKD